MIFLDTNVFLRFLVHSSEPENQLRSSISKSLIHRIARNELEATTTEVVLHEVAYILGSKQQYGLPSETVLSSLKFIVELPGIRLHRDDRYCFGRAFELLEQFPEIEFSDAVVAARSEYRDSELATFDRHFDAIVSVKKWDPASIELEER